MENKVLSGIERELVLQYLIDGNVPVTVTPVEENTSDSEIHSLSSVVFPVAIKAEQISVLKEGIILLKNSPKSVNNYKGCKVKVEFYFNSVGLYFVTEMKEVSSGPALVIPKEIRRIQDVENEMRYDFQAELFTNGKDDSFSVLCNPAKGFQLFSRPAWSTIPLEFQSEAKEYLETFVTEAKKTGRAGNGIQLVNICRYLVLPKDNSVHAFEGRLNPFDILFLNHERIVLAFEKNDSFNPLQNEEYGVTISFSLKNSGSVKRTIKVLIRADAIYTDKSGEKIAMDCSFSKIREEDIRFLYEKATSLLFY